MGSGVVTRRHVSPGIGACNSTSPISPTADGERLFAVADYPSALFERETRVGNILLKRGGVRRQCVCEKNRVPDFILYGRLFILTSEAKHNLETIIWLVLPSDVPDTSLKRGSSTRSCSVRVVSEQFIKFPSKNFMSLHPLTRRTPRRIHYSQRFSFLVCHDEILFIKEAFF